MNKYPYKFAISLSQEYHNFNFELSWIGAVMYSPKPLDLWVVGIQCAVLNFIISYSFDFSKNH